MLKTLLGSAAYAAVGNSALSLAEAPQPQEDRGLPANPPQIKISDTCYAGQITGQYADAIASSTFFVVVRGADGKPVRIGEEDVLAGSAFAVKDSDVAGHKQLLTDAHVVTPMPADARIEVTASDGKIVGYAAIAAIGTGHKQGSTCNDLAVLRIIEFVPAQQALYDARPGIPLGPQLRDGFLTGVASPVGITSGTSGGPLINEAGQAIGVALSSLDEPKATTVKAPKIQHPYKPGTHDLDRVEMEMAAPNRFYASTIVDPAIRDALGKASQGAPIIATMAETQVIISGAPRALCVISTAAVRALDLNSIEDFKRLGEEPVEPEYRFKFWNDPARAVTQLKSLLDETQGQLPDDKQLAAMRLCIAPAQDMRKMALDDLPQALIGWANAVENPSLQKRLVDATYNVDAWRLRSVFTSFQQSSVSLPAQRPTFPKP